MIILEMPERLIPNVKKLRSKMEIKEIISKQSGAWDISSR